MSEDEEDFSQCPCGRCTGDSMEEEEIRLSESDLGSIFRLCLMAIATPVFYLKECSPKSPLGHDIFENKNAPIIVKDIVDAVMGKRKSDDNSPVTALELSSANILLCLDDLGHLVLTHCKAAANRIASESSNRNARKK